MKTRTVNQLVANDFVKHLGEINIQGSVST